MKSARAKRTGLAHLLLALLTLQAIAACTGANVSATAKPNPAVKLYVMDCGHIEARDLSLFNPLIAPGTSGELANPCYLIQHPRGTMLWDAGIDDAVGALDDGIEVFGGAFHMSVKKTLASQLAEIGVTPEDVDYMGFSHLHNDHTGNAKYFPHATWLMQQAEQEFAYGEEAASHGYRPSDYNGITELKIQHLDGRHDLFGDGSVIVIPTPGHSYGHQSLLLQLQHSGPILLGGDLYHFQLNRDHYGIPVWNDKKATVRSFALIDQILEETGAELWIHHDKPQFDALKKAPAYYD